MERTKIVKYSIAVLLSLNSCASNPFSSSSSHSLISNPFLGPSSPGKNVQSQPLILRTKKGDPQTELEFPSDVQRYSQFVLPLTQNFQGDRSLASSSEPITASNYKGKAPTLADYEITKTFPQGAPEDRARQRKIEEDLNLTPEEDKSSEDQQSYLAALDHIKQLYRASRYEAALLEIEDLLSEYQTDPKLYEMRGTLLSKLGKKDLALISWNQSLRLDPRNVNLQRFIEKHKTSSTQGVTP